jgi:protein CWC15
MLEDTSNARDIEEEDPEAKRRRILEETRDIDADSIGSEGDSSDEDRQVQTIYGIDKMFCANGLSDDEEDEAAELMRELEKIKRERMEQKEKEASLLKYRLGLHVCTC